MRDVFKAEFENELYRNVRIDRQRRRYLAQVVVMI